jgi:hypothetical protein
MIAASIWCKLFTQEFMGDCVARVFAAEMAKQAATDNRNIVRRRSGALLRMGCYEACLLPIPGLP